MKTDHISRMERLRSINLRIGLATALFIAVLAFNWTIERPALENEPEENYQSEAEVKIIRTAQSSPATKPPPTVFKATDILVEVPFLTFNPEPTLISSEMPVPSSEAESYFPSFPEPVKLPLPVENEKPEKGEIFKVVEEMPRFPGCEREHLTKPEKEACATNLLLAYLNKNLRYPSFALDNGIEGTVVIGFVVEPDGTISNAKIVRDIGGGCGEEALRVVKAMPAWRPGMQSGRAVRVQFNLPVRFRSS